MLMGQHNSVHLTSVSVVCISSVNFNCVIDLAHIYVLIFASPHKHTYIYYIKCATDLVI